ncbi:glycosyltransferase family 1 protein [Chlorogloeopsis sp. ULAP01]|uniref:glycosyltransferase family 4 protein n=1 Tax=Chlorogloeopsis sp. ULAP01 TaxID=3056483 RepID=UPI0025AB43C5|nr:glycosyltransferase family 1 protein [Chlorogloeopsis sp. ULAP01]MDM9385347.1 glycosyltransferase family 1 protein [Chlorogloeopsis sp. ULAP01]
MKIGYWLGDLSIHNGGIAPYSWRLLEILLSQSKFQELNILVLCSAELEKNCLDLINKYQAKAKPYLIPYKSSFIGIAISQLANLLSQLLVKLNISNQGVKYIDPLFLWFASLDIDLLHVPYQVPPYYNLPYPLTVTMHDVQELHYPEFFTPQERVWRAEHYWKSLEKSSAIIVSFNHVKQDLIKYFRLDDNKIHISPLPYQKMYLQPPTSEEQLIYQNKYAKWDSFLLYPAQTWQHKNHLSLIKAVEYIKENFGRLIHILCTGKKNSRFFPVIENYLEKSDVADQIHFLDIVPETELYWLYKNCSLVVIPTLYEAGCLPLLEAMSLETPVICSSVTSIPEIIDDSRFIFNPLDINQIANLILQMLDNSELRTDNIVNSGKRISELHQIDSAAELIKVYQKVLSP